MIELNVSPNDNLPVVKQKENIEKKPQQYTVQEGDSLWTIAQENYNLDNNKDTWRAIDALAKTNNIEDKSIINTGDNLTLPEYDSIFGIYSNMVDWRQDHEDNAAVCNILLSDNQSASEKDKENIYKCYLDERNKIGTEFDFMEGKNSNNEKEYEEQLAKLATGDMNTYDLDGDGQVSRSEYMALEMKDITKYDNAEFRQWAATYAYLMFDIIDQGMGNSDSNEFLSEKEFESFYRNLDMFDGINLSENNIDGVITADGAENFAGFLVQNIFSQDKNVIETVYKSMKNI